MARPLRRTVRCTQCEGRPKRSLPDRDGFEVCNRCKGSGSERQTSTDGLNWVPVGTLGEGWIRRLRR